jgi:hypothetical protein
MEAERVIHQTKEQSGGTVTAKCGATFKNTSKTDEGTFWWRNVTCDACIDLIATTPTAVNYFNNREIEW